MRRTLALAGAVALAVTGLAGPASADSGGGIAQVADAHIQQVAADLDSTQPHGINGDFVLIINGSTGNVDVSNFQLFGCNTTSSFTIATIPSGTVLAPGQDYRVASDDYAGGPTRNLGFDTSADLEQAGGGVLLLDSSASPQAPDVKWGMPVSSCSAFTDALVSPSDAESINYDVPGDSWFLDGPT